MLSAAPSRKSLVDTVSGLLHADPGNPFPAAREVAKWSGLPVESIRNTNQAHELTSTLFYWCLNNDKYSWAASLAWGPKLFYSEPLPHCTELIWDAVKSSPSVLLMGAASMSKSYSTGVWLMLDWVRDPEYTSVKVIGPSENHLNDNLFTHLVTLHRESAIPFPGVVGERFIGLDRRARKSSISGVVIPLGKRASGRLQGTKRDPRRVPHPVFGPLSRLRVFIDELEIVPSGLWKDFDNILSNQDGAESFKVIGGFNPADPNGQAGQRCAPPGGWSEFDETTETWESARGWRVVRLDARKSENVIAGRTIYPGLQTREGLEAITKNAGGTGSAGYYTMVCALFPPEGAALSVIPQTFLPKSVAEVVWLEPPQTVLGVDVALEGADRAVATVGQFGRTAMVKRPATLTSPERLEHFDSPRPALQITQQFTLEKGNTLAMAKQIKELSNALGAEPGWVMVDRTGNGAGVHDMLREIWSPEVRGAQYSESATKQKILIEDTKLPFEEYERLQSELWFATKKWLEFEVLFIHPRVETGALFDELAGRQYLADTKRKKVEAKREYMGRTSAPSPDRAESFVVAVHCARVASKVVPGATSATQRAEAQSASDGPFCRVGETDRLDLDNLD